MSDQVPIYEKAIAWLISAALGMMGVLWGVVNSRHADQNRRIGDLDAKLNQMNVNKMDRVDAEKRIELLAKKTREDIINLHTKIDSGQKETRERLDRILERLS